ncbi:MAG: hypothetical protein NT177_08670 [Chloroflexi bacterium]|nr:hypothetical protein [Chloroflexota bacterium]
MKQGIMVLGIGNLLCRDDGIGIRIAAEMQFPGKYSGIRIIDGGSDPDLFAIDHSGCAAGRRPPGRHLPVGPA